MIQRDQHIQLIKKLETTEISGEKVMIDFKSGKYFMLKGVANDIWDDLQKLTSVDEIILNLLEDYEVEEKACEEAVISFLNRLYDYKFIEITSNSIAG